MRAMISILKKTGWLSWLLLIFVFSAQAAEQDALLKIHATLLPKTVLMDYQFEQKLVNNAIVVGILCEKRGRFSAERLAKYILVKYKNGIKDYPVKVKIFYYDNLSGPAMAATIYYFMPAPANCISTALELLQDERLIFSSDPADLRLGTVISIMVQQRVKPVINIDALRKRNISLRPVIMKISKMYYQPQ
jgi:hypothetical protein